MCGHALTNLQHKRACQMTSALFCIVDQSGHDHTYGTLLFFIALFYNNRYYRKYHDDKLTISRAENNE